MPARTLSVSLLVGFALFAPRSGIDPCKDTNGGRPARPFEATMDGSPLAGVEVLVYANFLESGYEKDNVVAVLKTAGASVTETATSDPSTLSSALVGKDCFVVPELLDDTYHDHPDPELDHIEATFISFRDTLDAFGLAFVDIVDAGIGGLTYQYANMTFSTADLRLKKIATLAGSPNEILVARKQGFVVLGYDYYSPDTTTQQLLINACLL